MQELPFNVFMANIKSFIDKAIRDKQQLKIIRRSGRDFIVVGVDDWENQQETIYVLQDFSLMKQIGQSDETHSAQTGYIPQKEEINEIIGI